MKLPAPTLPPCYVSGEPYRGLHPAHSGGARPRHSQTQLVTGFPASGNWVALWDVVERELKWHDYGPATRQFYRAVLRSFYRYARRRPGPVTAGTVRHYVDHLIEEHASWSWLAMNISVLRTIFDKLGSRDLTRHLATPKRPERLPEILSPDEVRKILTVASTTRDQLLLGLLYGCGLKVGELCQLRWCNVDIDHNALHVIYARGRKDRWVNLPPELLPVLRAGVSRCPAGDYIFQGRIAGRPLSTRMVELILRKAAKATDTLKTVTCMTLRNTYAVHCLEAGDSIRALQEALGHANIDTTQQYERCILPDVTSPLASIRKIQFTSHPSRARSPRWLPFFLGHSPCAPDDRDEPPGVQSPHPTQRLFPTPLSVEHLELPFPSIATHAKPLEFYRMLKTQLFGRFLCHRRASIRAG